MSIAGWALWTTPSLMASGATTPSAYSCCDRAVAWGREGKGLDGVRARIEANVGWRIVDIVRIGGRIHVVGPNLLGPVGQARVGVDEERQIGPILHEGLVVGLLGWKRRPRPAG